MKYKGLRDILRTLIIVDRLSTKVIKVKNKKKEATNVFLISVSVLIKINLFFFLIS